MSVVFEDIHPFNAGPGYFTPNENVSLWRDMVKSLPVNKAAGICSSGEVAFFSMLPSVKVELTLVDHSYTSLFYAIVKYLVVKEKGSEKAVELFNRENRPELKKVVEELEHLLPVPLKNGNSYFQGFWDYGSDLGDLWRSFSSKDTKKVEQKLGKVRFIHGDLTDLNQYGKYGLLYISNAHQHSPRYKRNGCLGLEWVKEIVRPGGFVMCAMSQYDFEGIGKRKWEVIDSKDSNNHMGWKQTIFRIPSER